MQTSYNKQEPKSLQKLFAKVAPNYDKTNLFLSFGMCKLWTRQLIKKIKGQNLLDLCAGTGEIAQAFLKHNPQAEAHLIDFCQEMLDLAQTRLSGRFTLEQADVHALKQNNNSFDIITMAYGVRNLYQPLQALQEAYRVLKSQGTLAILELTRPNFKIVRFGHKLYLKSIVPLIGKLLTQDKEAYNYLSQTIESFLSPTQLAELVEKAGFKKIQCTPLSGGIATLIIAKK